MNCPTCGTANDAQNRFCDQCGSRLEENGASAAPVAAAPIASSESATCPSCGASVIPGEAFCDECGASLNSVAPTASAAPAAPAAAAPAAGGNFCPACGHQNIPGDRFCDNCGAELEDISNISPEPTPAEPEAPAIPVEEEPAAPAEPEQAPPAEPAEPVEAPPAAPVEPIEEPAAVAAEEPEEAALAAPAAPAADTSADRQRIQDEIARQQQIISQFEQMVATFGAAAPAAVSQGLDEARAALASAELELSELDAVPAAPAVDPAELQRVQDEIARQQQIIGQFEQMIATFGAAAPAAVSQGLDEARTALAQAELELTALTGGSAPAAPAAEAPAAPAAPAAEAPAAPAAPAVVETPKPRLTFDNGQSIELPEGKSEYIIGREDPVSGIFPEVDLTNHGGETGGVSRQHARLNVDANGQWTLTDLNSTNYTRVNQTKADPNVAVPISDGAQVQFGRVLATFRTS